MKKVLITGGSGLIGQHLTHLLQINGYEVAWLSRNANPVPGVKVFKWDWKSNQLDEEALQWCENIIHLAGAGIANKRWTAKRKQLLLDSRVKTAQLLFEKISNSNTINKVFISASGVGYYGAKTTPHLFQEEDPPEGDFISDICIEWEKAVQQFEKLNTRVVILRTGVVLTKNGGALAKMKAPIQNFIGAPIGSGKQFFPWIHVYDLCSLYLFALENDINGSFNAAAPDIQTNSSFTKSLAKILKKPLFLPNIPKFTIKLLFGEMANLILEGSAVSVKKIQQSGFQFKFKKLQSALVDLLS